MATHARITRSMSYQDILRRLNKRQKAVLGILLRHGEGSAQTIADWLWHEKHTNNASRNNAAPRLTELADAGLVETAGKVKDHQSGKTVTNWKLSAAGYEVALLNKDCTKQE